MSKILADSELLSPSYLPEKLLHREEELNELKRNLKGFVNAFVCGPCDSGKTSLLKRAMSDLGKEVRAAYVDCSLYQTTYSVLKEALPRGDFILARSNYELTKELVRYSGENRLVICFDDFAKEHKMGIIMEDLKGMRKRINYGRMLNCRLHSWNFRRLQFYIEYKAKLEGLPVVYVNPKGTSSLCPVCGGKLAPNGHRVVRYRCGYENDRDVIACLNMLRMRGAPLPLKATYEALRAEAERIVIKC